MKKTIFKSAMYSSLLVLALNFSSCGKKNADTDMDTETTETGTMETESSDPVMDTVVEGNDTIVKTGGGENTNPTGEQVP